MAHPGPLQSLVEDLRGRTRAESCTLFRVDEGTGALEPLVTLGEGADLATEVPFGRGRGLSSWVRQQQRPVFLPSIRADQPMARIKSFLSVPLAVNGHVVGVVSLGSSRAGALTEEAAGQTMAAVPSLASAVQTAVTRPAAIRASAASGRTGSYPRTEGSAPTLSTDLCPIAGVSL